MFTECLAVGQALFQDPKLVLNTTERTPYFLAEGDKDAGTQVRAVILESDEGQVRMKQ